MPPPNNIYAAAAANYCFGVVASSNSKDASLAAIRGMLRGAPLPSVCRLGNARRLAGTRVRACSRPTVSFLSAAIVRQSTERLGTLLRQRILSGKRPASSQSFLNLQKQVSGSRSSDGRFPFGSRCLVTGSQPFGALGALPSPQGHAVAAGSPDLPARSSLSSRAVPGAWAAVSSSPEQIAKRHEETALAPTPRRFIA